MTTFINQPVPIQLLPFAKDDGGRQDATGRVNTTSDCGVRAIAIATHLTYAEACEIVNKYGKTERLGKRKKSKSTAMSGVYSHTMRKIMVELGWKWTPKMTIGSGCTVHVRAHEVPMEGPVILSLSRHYAAVVDGVLRDTYDCARQGSRCVYGWWTPARKES